MFAPLLKYIFQYLPEPFTIKGMIFFSFVIYIITYIMSYLRVRIVNNSLEGVQIRGSKHIKQEILKRRQQKAKAAQELAKALAE